MEMKNSLKSIKELGFKEAGKWELKGNKTRANFVVESKEKTLYAFVVDEVVVYIGATSRALNQRMSNYSGGDKKGTNAKMHKRIKGIIDNGKSVLIYTMSSDDIEKNIEKFITLIDFAAGLEKSVIRGLDPKWNKHGRKQK
jgi:hypothetical protein